MNKYDSPLGNYRLVAKHPKGIKPGAYLTLSAPIGIDGSGNFYLVWRVPPKKKIRLKNGVTSGYDLLVQKYSSTGKFITEVAVGRSWECGNSPNPFVDRQGRLYTLEYTDNGIQLIRWSPSSTK